MFGAQSLVRQLEQGARQCRAWAPVEEPCLVKSRGVLLGLRHTARSGRGRQVMTVEDHRQVEAVAPPPECIMAEYPAAPVIPAVTAALSPIRSQSLCTRATCFAPHFALGAKSCTPLPCRLYPCVRVQLPSGTHAAMECYERATQPPSNVGTSSTFWEGWNR